MKFVIPCTEDRFPQLETLLRQLRRKKILGPADRVVVVNQVNKPFNLGMARNVGIAHAPAHDGEVVCVHDVDNLPTDNYPHSRYPTPRANEVVHVYGHHHTLNGVICATYKTFCALGGYISKDTWGAEDEVLQKQCCAKGVRVTKNTMVPRFPRNNWFVEMDARGQPITNDRARAEFGPYIKQKMIGYKKPPALAGDMDRVRSDVTVVKVDDLGGGVKMLHVSILPTKTPHVW
jgi:glycosyltransferase involved in cell wall biosynthesis